MGYDDNTPLKGVTGGGLPAEIWRETMVRIEEGLPTRPLPLVAPERPQVVARGPDPVGAVQDVGATVQSAVRNMLNGLFGRN
jgi:membrane peptidoglycan carboxypeptidase